MCVCVCVALSTTHTMKECYLTSGLLFLMLSICCGLVSCDIGGFNCPPLPPLSRPAQSVHELRPQDIKVIMALGDSITAGFGAMGLHLFHPLQEYRGISWSIGGDYNATTLANFLKFYSPNITGASVGSHYAEICKGSYCYSDNYQPEQDKFNAAQTGAFTISLKRVEIDYLIQQVKKNPRVDIEKDWKVMTILIGYNDLCATCKTKTVGDTVKNFKLNLRYVLEKLRLNIPRTFVNLVELFNISMVYDKNKDRKYCSWFHKLLPVDCQCLWEVGHDWRLKMDEIGQQFNSIIQQISREYNEKKYNDFAVIAQPGMRDVNPDEIPLEFFSTLDCFHPSLVGHHAFAAMIWNNMLTPANKKTTTLKPNISPLCPTNSTLLYTY